MTTIAKTTKTTTTAALPPHLFKLTLAAVALASLAACGGGGISPNSAPTPAPVAVSGKTVINQGIKNAKACMDLNANSLCNTGEPASAVVTGVDGAYMSSPGLL